MRAIFDQAIAALDPAAAVARALPEVMHVLEGRTVRAFAIGKAAAAMARGVPYPVLQLPGPHPVPDARSVENGARLVELADSVDPDEAMLALISGGASAMAEVPTVPLHEYVARVETARRMGAPIAEVNALRASLSQIKGGKLAARCRGKVATIVLSDVVGDDPAIVGSGPTVPCDAVVVAAGVADLAREGARAASEVLGVPARVVDDAVTGDVEVLAHAIAREVQSGQGAMVWAGEPTILLPPVHAGVGGRARHVALIVARLLAGRAGWQLLAAGSDGIDGMGDVAGAIVDGDTWRRCVGGERALLMRDSGTVLAPWSFTTGPTGVNHCDLYVASSA